MMTAESRTENPPFCSLNQHWLAAPQTKSSAGWYSHSHSLPPLQTWLALYRGSHQSAQARQGMIIVGMLLLSITYLFGGARLPSSSEEGYRLVFSILRTKTCSSGLAVLEVLNNQGQHVGKTSSSISCLAWFAFCL